MFTFSFRDTTVLGKLMTIIVIFMFINVIANVCLCKYLVGNEIK
jgi:hypothetical protein